MRFTVLINQSRAIEWGLNAQQSILFAFLYDLPSWANELIESGVTWYNISKTKICQELPVLTDKPDTAYRLVKSLADIGLIDMACFDNKTYVRLTPKGKEWNESGSEKFPTFDEGGSEKNPSRVGKISDELSNKELNNKNNNTSRKKSVKKTFSEWAAETLAEGEKLIPDNHIVFDNAEKMGIPSEYLFLAWTVFKDYYTNDNLKKYIDWREVFNKAIKGDWLKLWAFNREGDCYLTPKGKMHQNALEYGK